MAGTVSITYGEENGGVRAVSWAWTSDASGNANGTATKAISGQVLRWVTNPGATAPTDDYDIVVNDADGVDIAAGTLANRDTTNSEEKYPAADTLPAFSGPLSLSVSNAGNVKQGVLTLYYRA